LSAASRGVVGDNGGDGVEEGGGSGSQNVDEMGGYGGNAGVTGAPRRATSSHVPPAIADADADADNSGGGPSL